MPDFIDHTRNGISLLTPASDLIVIMVSLNFLSCFRDDSSSGGGGDNNGVSDDVIRYLKDGFAKMNEDPKCKSLLKKYLTKEMLEALMHKKTASHGSTLKDVIQSGNYTIGVSQNFVVTQFGDIFYIKEEFLLSLAKWGRSKSFNSD